MEKENYYLDFLKEYHHIIANGNSKPKLLLHVCCGACSCYPLLFLTDLFDITIFFSNSNIYPEQEFFKRLNALKQYVNFINCRLKSEIKIVVDDYSHLEFASQLAPYKDELEGGKRCEICIAKRLTKAFEYASKNNFSFLTTVMTVSRNKNVNYINQLGLYLSEKFKKVRFINTDFKKNNGQDLGVMISKKLDIYRQDYCGCEFSIKK